MTSFKFSRRSIFAVLGGLSSGGAVAFESTQTSGPGKPSAMDPVQPDAHGGGGLTQPTLGQILYPQTEREISNGVIPTHHHFPPGNPRRYGAVGSGWAHDDTLAVQNCINCNRSVTFHEGDVYGVTSITFPAGGPDVVDFNGAFIVGVATIVTECIIAIKCSLTTFYGYQVYGLGNGSTVPNPNPNYSCATLWYNPAGGSQFNTFFGMAHHCCVRAVVFGALPGNTPHGGLQSENSIYGFRTIGCANPFYSNAQGGFVHFSEPIFYSGFESWTVAPSPNARALENHLGAIFAQGGELEYASTSKGFAADLQACILQGMNFETAPPIQIIGDGVQIVGGTLYNTHSATSEFKIAKGVTGSLTVTGASFARGTGAGAFSRQPMIDATEAASSFTTILQDTKSFEWAWILVGARCRLVNGAQASYRNHRMHITGTDPDEYVLNSNPTDSMISPLDFDHLGYTTNGWKLSQLSGNTGTLRITMFDGPADYLARQLTLTSSGKAQALCGDPTELATIQATCMRVRPGELYWLSCWINNSTATGVFLVANFYTLSGSAVATLNVADIVGIGKDTWTYVDGPIAVPRTAAYLSFGAQVNAGAVMLTDLRIRRAS